MAEPKKKLTRSRSGNRKSHDFLKTMSIMVCDNCKANKLPHRVCENCGYYNGKKVVAVEAEKVVENKQKEELEDE